MINTMRQVCTRMTPSLRGFSEIASGKEAFFLGVIERLSKESENLKAFNDRHYREHGDFCSQTTMAEIHVNVAIRHLREPPSSEPSKTQEKEPPSSWGESIFSSGSFTNGFVAGRISRDVEDVLGSYGKGSSHQTSTGSHSEVAKEKAGEESQQAQGSGELLTDREEWILKPDPSEVLVDKAKKMPEEGDLFSTEVGDSITEASGGLFGDIASSIGSIFGD